jgi:hypothetical protein
MGSTLRGQNAPIVEKRAGRSHFDERISAWIYIPDCLDVPTDPSANPTLLTWLEKNNAVSS